MAVARRSRRAPQPVRSLQCETPLHQHAARPARAYPAPLFHPGEVSQPHCGVSGVVATTGGGGCLLAPTTRAAQGRVAITATGPGAIALLVHRRSALASAR